MTTQYLFPWPLNGILLLIYVPGWFICFSIIRLWTNLGYTQSSCTLQGQGPLERISIAFFTIPTFLIKLVFQIFNNEIILFILSFINFYNYTYSQEHSQWFPDPGSKFRQNCRSWMTSSSGYWCTGSIQSMECGGVGVFVPKMWGGLPVQKRNEWSGLFRI